MNELKLLDDILKVLKDHTQENLLTQENAFILAEKGLHKDDSRLIYTVINKLVKDGYVEFKSLDENSKLIQGYLLTFEGLIFINKGGYKWQRIWQISKIIFLNISSILLVLSAVFAGIYYYGELYHK